MDSTELYLSILAIALLILCSGFFSGSETSLMASSKPKLHGMRKEGHKGAHRVSALLKKPETLLSTILLGNNLVNIGASALATGVFLQLFGDKGILMATVVMTGIVLIFAEVLPKTLASHYPERMAMVISMPMQIIIRILKPFTVLIRWITRFLMRLMGIPTEPNDPNFGEEDLKGAIGLGLYHGVLDRPEHRMLDAVLQLDEITVEDVMVHRSSIESIDVNLPLKELKDRVANSSHSRLPVWEDNPDNITGILHVRDFHRALYAAEHGGEAFNIRQVMQEPYFVPEQAIVAEQLMAFRKKRMHMGLVVDEYGDIMGIVTLEDILEEIVGEIEDEHDVVRSSYTRESEKTIVISGAFPVRDANREFDWDLPEDEAVTIGGLIVDELERIPTVGERVSIGRFTFEVLAKRRQALARVRVIANEQAPEDMETDLEVVQ